MSGSATDTAAVSLPGWEHGGRCRANRCPDPAHWSLVLDCPRCGALGSGVACDFHTGQAEEWGVPHVSDGQSCPEVAAVVSAIRLKEGT